jgi:competence protein ComEC
MTLIWGSISFIIGTWIGSSTDIQAGIWLGFAALFLAGNLILKRLAKEYEGIKYTDRIKILFLISISLFIGAARYSSTRIEIDVNHAAWYNDSGDGVFIEGIVYKFPDERDNYTNIYISVERLGRTEFGMRPVEGNILLKLPRNNDLMYGDKIKFRGELLTPDEQISLIYQFLPDPEASLLAGIVLGYESGIEEDVQKAFRDTGTTHVIAISGAKKFNVAN